jgi:DNA sulfur modification protein DndD
MRLLNLTVNDFGLFRGSHDFDLSTARGPDGTRRNLIVFKGPNGVGKSTLFQSLLLALHGSLALGDRVSRQEYNEYLLKRMHRFGRGDRASASGKASVSLSFQYVQSGILRRIQVERLWERSGLTVTETLRVLCDGKQPEVDAIDYQGWLNDLVPPGLSALCFFDAERLDAFSNPDQHDGKLAEVLRRLLGLDIVERLQTDLDHYLFSKGGGRKALDKLRAEVINCQTSVDALNAQLSELRSRAEELNAEQRKLESELAEQERRLVAEGGLYASRRTVSQERLKVVEREIDALENELRDMSADLLPFALAPQLCFSLRERLKQESKARTEQAAEVLWEERIVVIKQKLHDEKIWQGLKVSANDRKKLAARLARAIGKSGSAESRPMVHNLSEPECEKLQGWLTQAVEVVPKQVKAIGVRLRELQEEKRKIASDIKRAPDEAALAPIHAEITRLQGSLGNVQQRQAELNAEKGALQFRYDDAERQLQRARGEFEKARLGEKQLMLAERSRATLRVYKDALTRQRLAALEKALVASFNRICRKDNLLGLARVRPDDFSVELRGESGHAVSLSEFSAGERQLYALSLLWSLRQVSGYQLPIAIDTPLGRLDETHRHRIINDYVPAVSDQVLLFATDAELDEELMAEAQPSLVRVYRLDCSSWSEYAQVRCISAVPEGIVLYRGALPGVDTLKDHEEYGEVWTTDFEQAISFGKVKRAVLPDTARRLVLVDPITNDYNWEHIAELERLSKDRSIAKKLRAGHQIYDIWRDEWTLLLQKARYDSIATVTIEGPEEHVLNPSKLISLKEKAVETGGQAFDA